MGLCTEPRVMIVMERMKTDLETLLSDPAVKLSLAKRLGMLREGALGLNWLHSSHPAIIHMDLKVHYTAHAVHCTADAHCLLLTASLRISL